MCLMEEIEGLGLELDILPNYTQVIISNLTKKFPEVAQLEQPTETSENLETRTFRNLSLISWKPTLGLRNGNLETTEIW